MFHPRTSTGPLPQLAGLVTLAGLLLGACAPTSDAGPAAPAAQPALASEPATVDPPPPSAETTQEDTTPALEARPKDWPEPLPWVASLHPEMTTVEAGAAGDHYLHRNREMAPLKDVADPWRESLKSAGFVEVTPCAIEETAATLSCTYRQADRLALLNIAPHSGDPTSDYTSITLHLLPPGHRALDALPGPCVEPPVRERLLVVNSAGIDQRGEHHRTSRDWRLSTHATLDLDGDGVSDTLVPAKKAGECPWEIPMDVYIMRGECGHRVGTILGNLQRATITAPFVGGLREVSTEATWADFEPTPTGADDPPLAQDPDDDSSEREKRRRSFIPSHHARERKYHFDGKTLRLVSDHDQVGRCHHCGTSTCSSR